MGSVGSLGRFREGRTREMCDDERLLVVFVMRERERDSP